MRGTDPASQDSPTTAGAVQVRSPGLGQLSCRSMPCPQGRQAATTQCLFSTAGLSPSLPCSTLLGFPAQLFSRPATLRAAQCSFHAPLLRPPPSLFPLLIFFPSTHKLQLFWFSHTSSTNCCPPHVFSVHRYTDLVTVILFSFKMVNGFGLSFSPLCVQLSGLYKASIKQSFRHFCSLCTRVKCLKRCKIVKNQCGVFLPHSCLPISF